MNRNGLFLQGLLKLPSLCAVLGAVAVAQAGPRPLPWQVVLRDGSVRLCQTISASSGESWRLIQADGSEQTVAVRQVLALHGARAQHSQLPEVHLVGGDVVRGLLVGGDEGGNELFVQSPVLGRTSIPVDRLDGVVLRPGVASIEDLRLPSGVEEALFQKARLGFDRLAGTVYQFGEGRVRFQLDSAAQPRWFRSSDLVGLRLGGGMSREVAAGAELITRAGDRLGVTYRGIEDGRVAVEVENGKQLSLPLEDLACLTFLDHGALFLSSLQPTKVVEVAFDGDVLLPWRRNATVSGDMLTVGGRTHGKGLGVHSRSQLTYVVPDGYTVFWSRVVFDDEALQLPVRGVVDVRVEIGGRVAFAHQGLRAGDEVVNTGQLPVEAGDEVVLIVDFGAGRDLGDRVDWVSPVFLAGDTG